MDDPVVIWAIVAAVVLFFVQLCDVALAEDRRVRRQKASACTACGYELVDGLCPECGPLDGPGVEPRAAVHTRRMFGVSGVVFTLLTATLLGFALNSLTLWRAAYGRAVFTGEPGVIAGLPARYDLFRAADRLLPHEPVRLELHVDGVSLLGTVVASADSPMDWAVITGDGPETSIRAFLRERGVETVPEPGERLPRRDDGLRELSLGLAINLTRIHPATQHQATGFIGPGNVTLSGSTPVTIPLLAAVALGVVLAAALRWIAIKIGRSGVRKGPRAGSPPGTGLQSP